MFSLCMPVFSSVSSHSPKIYKLGVRLTGHSKLPVGLNGSVNGCSSLYVSPVMNWQLVLGDPPATPDRIKVGWLAKFLEQC